MADCKHGDNKSERQHWQDWVQFLQHWGVKDFATTIIDSAGPLNIFAAQMIHFAQPFLRLAGSGAQWARLAAMLEDRQQSSEFVAYLRGKETA
jgi:hypothetical protein